ncbi:response regulator [Brevibacillus migulae]|uniref:response regulator n=1 Tax=Brevibacillus migulae TaxID=1644114 RepID=UPI00106E7700|nr:response regulator [Brevibacillus migulae]
MAQVLIADDSYIVRESLKKILSQSEHEVVAEATNGEEAYLQYRLHRPDLVTMDINMPVMNGIDTVKKIKHEFPDARIVMISTLGFQDQVFEAIKAGARHYIIKPFDHDKFFSVIDLVLSTPRK